MEEFIIRLIERVGYPVAVSLLSFWGMYKLFQLREADRNGAIQENTRATREQTEYLKKFGSDPTKICQAAGGQMLHLTVEDIEHVRALRAARAAQKLKEEAADDAVELKAKAAHVAAEFKSGLNPT